MINIGAKYYNNGTGVYNPNQHAYNNDYNMVLKEANMPATYHTIGTQVTLQLPRLITFADMKYVLNKTNGVQNTELWGFNVLFGTLISLDVLKF